MMITTRELSLVKQLANTVRALSIGAIQKANLGHPGLPLGCAEVGSLLYSQILRHAPKHPDWIDRDRFILSAGPGSMVLYSLLGLCGYGTSVDEIMQLCQFGSRTPGHPEYGLTAGVKTTTGPLGDGFATAVGLAIAETRLAALFNTPHHTIINHRTFVLAGDGCMQEGVTSEAASLAGHLGLGKLVVVYDSHHITTKGHADASFTEDVGTRFQAYGWQVLTVDGYDLPGLVAAFSTANAEPEKPTLIVASTTIDKGGPNQQYRYEVHGSLLGMDEVAATKTGLGLDSNQSFQVPEGVASFIADLSHNWNVRHSDWLHDFEIWGRSHPDLLALWKTTMYGTSICEMPRLPPIDWPAAVIGDKLATQAASGNCLRAAAATLPFLIGGSADLTPSNNTEMKGRGVYQKSNRAGRNLHFGVREHAMGSIVNGLTLHGGVKAFGATFLVFSDSMRPSLRLAALMRVPSIFVLTHDSIWVGEDGPAHQPVEHLSSLRIIPGLETLRPGDAEETSFVWELALSKGFGQHSVKTFGSNKDVGDWQESGPSAIVLTRQILPLFAKPKDWRESVRRTGSFPANEVENPRAVILASGSEVFCALEAAEILAREGKAMRVLSVPSLDRFRAAWSRGEIEGRESLVPADLPVFAIEAADYSSWAEFVSRPNFVGVRGFGESGPGETVAKHFKVCTEGLVSTVRKMWP